jgi:NAD(P)-dependent dehydrogenase (short-subunit alcohol dehydrogenase family)
MELKNKLALITGASRGIGAATAKLLAANGAAVGVNYVTRPDKAEQVVRDIAAAGGKAFAIQADVSDPAQAERMVERAVKELGRLDVLVNNAGGPAPGSIESVTLETWRRAIAVHVDGPFYCTRAAIPYMKKQGEGAIVNISSVAGLRGCAGTIAYQTVKCAVLAFTRGLARDLAEYNIRVNCVSPGIIRTDFHAKMTEEQKKFNLDKRIPLHREGKPEDVAEAILLLVRNDYMTGENVVVDAGLTMRIA